MFFPDVRDGIPYPYNTVGNIMVSYILICIFSDEGRKGKTV
jgi:hypothetical protein